MKFLSAFNCGLDALQNVFYETSRKSVLGIQRKVLKKKKSTLSTFLSQQEERKRGNNESKP